ncbi:2-amino-4-hydroxy-6-hydroxymethyldihydropteridine diphosphokinase [Craterilacuibacter sinensis]|uniref:2-amino-4-hydroxy-6-hydroxymethyldihydropteridine pyrophosphokinase n=1 Tax=Craterilacuibacter sinensis TaxID=2686017 RepID=A0A845BHH9_9NEIS|nr:2-amino-4-hydroxy-6-hydroxymethyldihydropteridine diphosphokinase [Craterilacuibacter sinensis]MXR36187.1 2-amino-4-hydroxy-6-hydroxymethyldihydropteridine diphosphokinase [Craterilacuibacter sinensis]
MTRAFVALGSNLDNPAAQLKLALVALAALPGTSLLASSALYRTTPVGFIAQPDFVNAVAELDTALDADALLDALMQIERMHGRVRSFRNAPRVLDLDLLTYGDEIRHSEVLTLPHPRMHERAFVLQPLAQIAPDYQLGHYGSARELAERLGSAGIERLND